MTLAFGAVTVPISDSLEAKLREVLAPAVARDPCWDMDEAMGEVHSGEATAWIISDGLEVYGAVLTKIVGESRKQLFVCLCAGRDAKQWVHFIDTLERWAVMNGCDSIEVQGRRGWQRLLGKGWDNPSVTLRKTLTHAE